MFDQIPRPINTQRSDPRTKSRTVHDFPVCCAYNYCAHPPGKLPANEATSKGNADSLPTMLFSVISIYAIKHQ